MHNLYSSFKFLAFFTVLFGLIACGDADEESNTVSIEFVSASPTSITLQGTGGTGLSETSLVTFRIKDPDGAVLEAQSVEFSLSTSVGGITLSSTSDTSDSAGLVTTVVQSGAIPTAVRIISSIPGANISTLSDQLTITSGIPDQDSSSLSVEMVNPEGYGIDGTEVGITMRLGDIFNNPVPAGTSVSFTTEGGIIGGSCITDTSSGCNVTWTSQNPRPIGGDGIGILTIMATALGQESFTDNNGNGIFDTGDSFDDLAEAFRDDNNNGSYDLGEFFEDLNNDGLHSAADGLYNGSSCMPGFALCSSQKNVHIRRSTRLVMSTSFGDITLAPQGTIDASAASVTRTVTIEDDNGNAMPAGSNISITTDNGEIQNSATLPTEIPDNLLGSFSFSVTVGSDDDSTQNGLLLIQVTTPDQNITNFQVRVDD